MWDNAPVAYHTLDKHGVITQVNQTELRILGYKREEMIGHPIWDFVAPQQREEARQRFLQKLSGEETPRTCNRVYYRRDGSSLFVAIDDMLELDEKGKVTGVRTTMVDITERKKVEDELQASLGMLKKPSTTPYLP
jgi:PAS domain S-box-containing protein